MDKKLIESKMIASVNHFTKEINGLRTGRASTALVETILVESYGSKLPLNQVGNIAVPEARLIVVKVSPSLTRVRAWPIVFRGSDSVPSLLSSPVLDI